MGELAGHRPASEGIQLDCHLGRVLSLSEIDRGELPSLRITTRNRCCKGAGAPRGSAYLRSDQSECLAIAYRGELWGSWTVRWRSSQAQRVVSDGLMPSASPDWVRRSRSPT